MSNQPQPQERDIKNARELAGESAIKSGADLEPMANTEETAQEAAKAADRKGRRLTRGS